MPFGDILKQAWQLPWKHKILLKIAFAMSIPAVIGAVISMVQYLFFFPSLGFMFDPANMDPAQMEQLSIENLEFVQNMSWMSLISIPLSLITIGVMLFGAIAIVKVVQHLMSSEEEIKITELREQTLAIVGRVFLLNLALYAILMFGGFALMIPMVFISIITFGLAMFCFAPLMIAFSILSMAFFTQTNIALIVEDLSITDAFKAGWAITKENIGNLAIISFLFSIAMFGVSLITLVPTFAFTFFLAEASTAIKISIMLMSFPFIMLGQILSFSFMGTGWVLTYFNLPKKPHHPSAPESPLAEFKDLSTMTAEDTASQ